jgi:RecA/RadA recombinase
MSAIAETADKFAPQFKSMSVRLRGELEDRQKRAENALPFGVSFLDDYLRGILANDLVLIGAPSGVGKTDLALSIALKNALMGKTVCFFALEAEERELERRMKYGMLARAVYGAKTLNPRASELSFTEWLFGRCEDIVGPYNEIVDRRISQHLGNLRTFYRGTRFGPADLATAILEIHETADLIVVDHIHYVDLDDENEARALGDAVKVIRDVSLRVGKPVILVAHLRKRDSRAKQLVATLEDFHGSSNLTKICTQAVTIERAYDVESPKWYLAPTFIAIPKDRRAGSPGVVAVTMYDRRFRTYETDYTLGLIRSGKWEAFGPHDAPSWAKGHKPLAQGGA